MPFGRFHFAAHTVIVTVTGAWLLARVLRRSEGIGKSMSIVNTADTETFGKQVNSSWQNAASSLLPPDCANFTHTG